MAIIRNFLFILLGMPFGFAQESTLKPRAICSRDTVKIGEPFQLSLYLDYPSSLQIFFPDSSYAFPDCILKERVFYPTKSRNRISRDCVVYHLACFSPEPKQFLQLPVMQLIQGDTLRFPSNEISFSVRTETGSGIPEKVVFLKETRPVPVPLKINYPYILSGLTLFFLLILVLNFFLDKPIQRFFSLWIDRRRHLRFLRAFERMSSELMRELSVQKMEALMLLWKQYLQRVEGKPFLSYTSLEINRVLPDSNLKKSLQEIDRWIYGGLPMENPAHSLQRLQEKSVELYEKKRELTRNGKSGK